MVKRILLFLITNILVMTTLSTLTSVLGLHSYLTSYGLDLHALVGFCLVWGLGGAILSLWMSRWIAKMAVGVRIINPAVAFSQEKELLDTVYTLARKSGLNVMPEVGIYDAAELNAFATGPSRNKALIAVSKGLLSSMTPEEREGVLAHEISHIANGDMVTMTLVQGVVNAFSLFLSRILAYAINMSLNRGDSSDRGSGSVTASYYIMTIIFDILFTLLGSLVVAAFSRYREYRADKGGAYLVGHQKMIAALKRLKLGTIGALDTRAPSLAPLKISRPKRSFLTLFASHPDLELRIKALNNQ